MEASLAPIHTRSAGCGLDSQLGEPFTREVSDPKPGLVLDQPAPLNHNQGNLDSKSSSQVVITKPTSAQRRGGPALAGSHGDRRRSKSLQLFDQSCHPLARQAKIAVAPVGADLDELAAPTASRRGPPVLILQGATFPSGNAAGWKIDGRSWMDELASAGYDV